MNNKAGEKSQVWIWAEHYQGELAKVSLGLVGKARELCEQLGGGEVVAVLVGGSQPMVVELIDHGSDKVFLADDLSLSPFDTELCAHHMAGLIRSHQPEIVLWGATSLGREIASRVAAKLSAGLTAHCIDLKIEEIKGEPQLAAMVVGWGGNMTLKIIYLKGKPWMATVNPGIFPPLTSGKRSGEVISVKFEGETSRLDIVEVIEQQEEADSVENAEIVVAGGWGLNSLGGFKEATELAQILRGSVAGTRPALDAGWIPVEKMIGQSGKTAAPRLLITLGVSGAAQFTTAVLNSKFILAIDKNPKAPVFEMADMGIVGELREVLPLLIEQIRAVREKT